ncbi:MAG: hypothetical protein MZU97_03265 [Bacillus subtilis]|nr:hypothetical protein [Bacillus subtilis]
MSDVTVHVRYDEKGIPILEEAGFPWADRLKKALGDNPLQDGSFVHEQVRYFYGFLDPHHVQVVMARDNDPLAFPRGQGRMAEIQSAQTGNAQGIHPQPQQSADRPDEPYRTAQPPCRSHQADDHRGTPVSGLSIASRKDIEKLTETTQKLAREIRTIQQHATEEDRHKENIVKVDQLLNQVIEYQSTNLFFKHHIKTELVIDSSVSMVKYLQAICWSPFFT